MSENLPYIWIDLDRRIPKLIINLAKQRGSADRVPSTPLKPDARHTPRGWFLPVLDDGEILSGMNSVGITRHPGPAWKSKRLEEKYCQICSLQLQPHRIPQIFVILDLDRQKSSWRAVRSSRAFELLDSPPESSSPSRLYGFLGTLQELGSRAIIRSIGSDEP